MNPAIIVIVNYRHRPRGPNIAKASCQSAENCHKYMRLGPNLWAMHRGFGLRLNFCFALLCLLCFGLRLKSQTKRLVWDFSLRPNLNLNSVWNHFLAVQIYVWSETKVSNFGFSKRQSDPASQKFEEPSRQSLWLSRSLQNIGTDTDRSATYNFLLVIHYKDAPLWLPFLR